MAGGAEGKPKPLEFTPTWIVASICSVIILISLLFERCLHLLGKVRHDPCLSFCSITG
jgi:mlo protein